MPDNPQPLTDKQLLDMGYAVEEYIEEYWQGPVLNESHYFRVIAPDGQLIAEDCTNAADAWGWVRWHYAKDTADATE